MILAATGVLSNCGSMHEAIYYDTPSNLETSNKSKNDPAIVPTTIAGPVTSNETSKQVEQSTKSGLFMQPEVFTIPKDDDLKETETVTKPTPRERGLTIPKL